MLDRIHSCSRCRCNASDAVGMRSNLAAGLVGGLDGHAYLAL